MLVHSSRHDASALSPQAQENPSNPRKPLKLKIAIKLKTAHQAKDSPSS